ncbi:hypothetical protein [Bradyrhizobium erythrophlei]|uniref:Uncharacterized protein n=1 Tax=Bradyrhizobium erythrophlei TaxID=1437360 RepID=A0A1H5JH36_9BRAD|nr:hypothetical protein [Bradyrhizobium erythrophlei]SEE51311.1 hypothetical protein SAMN05444164_8411 [Bradyrhizobium erythrophlei]
MVPEKKNKGSLPARRPRKPNALKHGAYSSIELLPWEDPDAFEGLRRAIWEEWGPEGPSEHDCVETMFLCLWRKHRVRAKRKVDTAVALDRVENRVFQERPPPVLLENELEVIKHALAETHSPPRDDYERLLSFSASLHLETDAMVLRLTISLLPTEFRDHLNEKVREDSHNTTQDWLIALKREIDYVLLPRIRERRPDPNGYLPAAAEILAAEKTMEDLAVEERLDAALDRAMRRLYFLKAQKQLEREAKAKVVNGKAK